MAGVVHAGLGAVRNLASNGTLCAHWGMVRWGVPWLDMRGDVALHGCAGRVHVGSDVKGLSCDLATWRSCASSRPQTLQAKVSALLRCVLWLFVTCVALLTRQASGVLVLVCAASAREAGADCCVSRGFKCLVKAAGWRALS